MPTLQPFHLRRLRQWQTPSDWPGGSCGEMQRRWYPLWWLLRSPYFSEWEVARLVALKEVVLEEEEKQRLDERNS